MQELPPTGGGVDEVVQHDNIVTSGVKLEHRVCSNVASSASNQDSLRHSRIVKSGPYVVTRSYE